MFPNFIIGGTAAGGTSFLSAAIIQHPEIFLPKKMRPEPHFFYKSWEYEKGTSYYEEKYFSEVKEEKAIGERSSSYLFGGIKNAERIKKSLPDIKLIFTLRNPIERAYANYRYTALQGLEDCSFDEAIKNEKARVKSQAGIWREIQPFNYTGRGMYGSQIEQYLQVFDKNQILILKSENMSFEPYESFKKVFDFLEVDNSFMPSLPPNHTSMNVKDAKLQQSMRNFFGDKFDLIIEDIRKINDISKYAENDNERQHLEKMRSNFIDTKIPISNEIKIYLQNYFEEDIMKLKNFIDFDIDDWC